MTRQQLRETKTRVCRLCRRELPFEKLIPQADCLYGYQARCRECEAKKARERYKKNPHKHILRKVEYLKTERGKQSQYGVTKRQMVKYPEKSRARARLRYALKAGTIRKPDACQSCEATGQRIEGHHDDYSKPLVVLWLCPSCHRERHGRLVTKATVAEAVGQVSRRAGIGGDKNG